MDLDRYTIIYFNILVSEWKMEQLVLYNHTALGNYIFFKLKKILKYLNFLKIVW